jgi:hypothetical protein
VKIECKSAHWRRLTPAAAAVALALATVAHAQPPGREAGPPQSPTQGELIFQAAIAASHADPAKWDWPASASPEVRQQITEGHYTPEELRNIFTVLARSSGANWPNSGPKAASPNMDALTTPDAISHGRGFRGLEVFYGSNGYGGVSNRVNHVDALLAHGDRVYISWVWEGQHTGKLFGFPGDGKTIHVRESSMTRFKNGKAVEIDNIGDDLAVYTQAGGKVSFPDKAQ